jgi:hypothetical protein
VNAWLRLAAAAAVVVAAALLLKVLPAFVVLALFVVGLALATRALKQRSEQEAAAGRAAILGLRRDEDDGGFALRTLPLALFARAPDGSIGDPMSGTWRGVEVRTFGYAFSAELPGGERVRRSLSCALGPVDVSAAAMIVEPRPFVTMFPEPPPLAPVEERGGRFGDLFEVRATDPAFVDRVLGERLREWLLGTDEGWGFEIRESAVLAYGPRVGRADPSPALDALVGFLDHLPATLRSRPGGAGPEAPLHADPGDAV